MSKRNVLLIAATALLCSSCIELHYTTEGRHADNMDFIYLYIILVGIVTNSNIRDKYVWRWFNGMPPVKLLGYFGSINTLCASIAAPFVGYLVATYTHVLESEVISYICGYIIGFGIVLHLANWILHVESLILYDFEIIESIINWLSYLLIIIGVYHIYTLFAN